MEKHAASTSVAPPDAPASAPHDDRRPASAERVVALVGNPNTGKTSLFNALTGFRRHVANYAGVTVDIARGPIRGSSRPLSLLDLPGAYSLAATSPDEAIVSDVLLGRRDDVPRPDALLVVVDASNPQRNFYLVSQLVEVGLPMVVALNMVDIARNRGIAVDARKIARRLGCPVVPVVATDDTTIPPLVAAIESAIGGSAPVAGVDIPATLRQEAARLASATSGRQLSTVEAVRLLSDPGGYTEHMFRRSGGDAAALAAARERLTCAGIEPGPAEVHARYAWVDRVLSGAIERRLVPGDTWSHRLDRVLTHRVLGGLILVGVLYALFFAIYSGAAPLMGAIEAAFGAAGQWLGALLPEGVVRSLVVDGVIAGVGGVIVFLPQILVLFLFVALLEDCGYLSRAAFMVDRLMRPMGLSGRSFIPLLSSFACAVPAILGTRAIPDRRERFITIMVAPFMSCSARLPVYVLLIGALIPPQAWLGGLLRLDALVLLAMYLVGVVVAIPVAILLNNTALAGPSTGLLLELPGYKWPRVRTVAQRVYLAGKGFLVRAGTVILLVNIAVWALGYFPRSDATRQRVERERITAGWSDEHFEAELAGAYLRESYLGRIGHWIEPLIEPIGWDWRIGVGVVASFPAREVIIATLGTVFNLGTAEDELSGGLLQTVRSATWTGSDRPLFTLPVALSLMVFFSLCAQCASTLAVIGKETGSWAWPVVSFVGMTSLAYVAAWATAALTRALLGS
ncbi:MAG: ferrous iron transport protein B [Phycisphaerales bacterium]|nr:ferrous iron transport protein B [Phycisphaerales bacterium]